MQHLFFMRDEYRGSMLLLQKNGKKNTSPIAQSKEHHHNTDHLARISDFEFSSATSSSNLAPV
jgi:hypothetical protein